MTLDQGSYEWGVYFEGDFPENGVVANDFENLFVGRTVTDSDISTAATRDEVPINLPYGRVATTQLPGKIHPSHECLYVPWAGKEYVYETYEVLMLKTRPKSLQNLCRNSIITATLGFSDRIDQLPIPANLKAFCKTFA